MKKFLPLILLCSFTAFCSAQFGTTAVPKPPAGGPIVFKYDDAGNQIYRGYDCAECAANGNRLAEDGQTSPGPLPQASSEDAFWNEIQIYPVPVRDILTIGWTANVDALIADVSLYEQNTVHWKFQQKNLPSLNREIKLDMSAYYMGVYILVFQLKDGRMLSRNITKF